MLNRPLVPPLETFEEDRRLHNKCGWHVQLLYYGHAIISVVVDVLGVLVGLLLFFYPQYHKGTSAYRQLFQVQSLSLDNIFQWGFQFPALRPHPRLPVSPLLQSAYPRMGTHLLPAPRLHRALHPRSPDKASPADAAAANPPPTTRWASTRCLHRSHDYEPGR